MDEKTLIKGLRAGTPKVVRTFVDQYQQLVLRTARGFVRNTEDARDITQDVFVDLLSNLHRFKGQSSLSTWIYRITVNRSLNFIRRAKKRTHLSIGNSAKLDESIDRTAQLTDPAQKSPVELLVQQDRARILHQALESLPANQRIAITLFEYDDLTYKDIAEIMKVTVSAVESLIFRARRNLYKQLFHCYKKSC